MATRLVWLKRIALASAAILVSSAAQAEFVISGYGGIQGATDSNVSGNDLAPGGVGGFDFDQRWKGKSFTGPIYWGVRGTWWIERFPGWGVSAEYNHAKVYADTVPPGWQTLEFTDGLNYYIVSALYRFKDDSRRWTPYVGVGAGVSVPHVEVQTSPTAPLTFDYQVGGPAFQVLAGVDFRITDWLSVFGEYKGNYAINDVDLVGGGSLSTDIFTNAVNIGLSVHF